VSDHDTRLTQHQAVQCVEDQLLRLRVQPGGRLVQNQDRQIADQRPRNRNALPLPPGQRHAALAHDRVVAIRHLVDKLRRIRLFRRAFDLLHGRARFAVRDVGGDRPVKKQRLLQHEADLLAQRRLLELSYVESVDLHRAGGGVVKACHQARDGRLSGPGRTH
jgi:hypothetical protein